MLGPDDLTVWQWLFESGQVYQPPSSSHQVQGFTDVTTKKHVSYTDVKNDATSLSSALSTSYSLGEGDVVVVYSRNSLYFPIAALATVRVGGIACGASPDYNSDELSHTLRISKAKFIFTAPDIADSAFAAAAKVGISKQNVFLVEGTRQGMKNVETLIDEGRRLSRQVEFWKLPSGKTNKQICGYLGFSSGTTGLPKAIMISHANVIAQCLQMLEITPSDHRRILAALPFYHITGIVHQFHLPILLNAHVYVVPKFSLDVALQAVVDYKVKELLLVPPIIIQLVRNPQLVAKYDLKHVERFSSGAAPLSQEILTALEKQFPGTGFKQGYGMTESCSVICGHPPSKYDYKYAFKVGALVGSTELRIVDPATGKDCGTDTPGELWARGPQITMGYLDNQKATAETFDNDGFLHTGDVGMIDSEGMISITDRIKDMIKVKGIGVAPAELEDLLLGHPLVSDVAVCGIADDRAGERPKAYVSLKANVSESPEAAAKTLLGFVKDKKTRHKWVAEIEVVSSIPKSAAGKILRRKLRDGSGVDSIAVVRESVFKSRL